MRMIVWLIALAGMLAATLSGNAAIAAGAAFAALAALALSLPRSLLPGIVIVVALALALLVAGGAATLVDSLSALVAGFVGWLFARTLVGGRQPLIARAIAAIDGEKFLAEPAVARYGRRLTALWAVLLATLCVLGAACAAHAHGLLGLDLPPPRVFAALILPGACIAAFVIEFALRRVLLPQAPRHAFAAFVTRLVASWPRLLD